MSPAQEALAAALHGARHPAKVFVRVTGTTSGWIARAGLLVPHGSSATHHLVSPGHPGEDAAWAALLEEIRTNPTWRGVTG